MFKVPKNSLEKPDSRNEKGVIVRESLECREGAISIKGFIFSKRMEYEGGVKCEGEKVDCDT